MSRDLADAKPGKPREPGNPSEALRPLMSREVFFYLWLPAGLGLFMGATQAGRTYNWPLLYSTTYFVAVCCLDWWAADLGCRLLRRVLQRWQPALWLILVGGALLAAVTLVRPVNWLLVQTWHSFLPPDITRGPLPSMSSWGQLEQVITGILPFILANYAFLRFAGMPRYGFTAHQSALRATKASSTDDNPAYPSALINKVRADRRGKLLALNAQGHYLKVITDAGEDLVLYRFGDAVLEMPPDAGVQVHRSWWLSQEAIAEAQATSAKTVRLSNGLKIPVSRTYQRELANRLAS